MSTTSFQSLLEENPDRVLLMDGGMGTCLEDRGINVKSNLWGSYAFLSEEGRVMNDQLHREFVEAGAEIVIANTHNASARCCSRLLTEEDLSGFEFPEEVTSPNGKTALQALHSWINRLALESVRQAAPKDHPLVVAAGIGSVDGAYAEKATFKVNKARDMLTVQVEMLQDLETDLIIFETLTTPSEIEAVSLLTQDLELTNFAVGLTCGPDGKTWGGVSMKDVLKVFKDFSPLTYFVQCSYHEEVERPLKALLDGTGGKTPVGVYANDGRTWSGRAWIGERTSPKAYAHNARSWRDAGARVIGGCCGTSPEHIVELKKQLF